MKILSIGMDRELFVRESSVRKRILAYGSRVNELHIIVFSLKKHKYTTMQISENVYLYPTDSRNRFFYIIDAFFIGFKICRKIRGKHFLITTQDVAETGIVGMLLSLVVMVPLHAQVHTDIFSPHYKQESALNRIRVLLAHLVLRRASRIRVVSERIKKSIISVFGEKYKTRIDTLPIFVDMSLFQKVIVKTPSHAHSSEKTILIVARLEQEKNIALALHTLADTLPDFPDTKLVIVGGGSLRGALEKLVIDLRLEYNVEFIGKTDAVSDYYAQADIYLQTSNYEGYGMALIEAAMSKCPIVTTDVGLVGEILKDNVSALVCSVGKKECLAQKVRSLLGNAQMADELGENAFMAVNSLEIDTVSVYMQKYLESWNKAL